MIFLNCPSNEKDECKALGGKWDSERKKWYVPDGIDASSFQKWIESDLLCSSRQPPAEIRKLSRYPRS